MPTNQLATDERDQIICLNMSGHSPAEVLRQALAIRHLAA